MAPLDGSLLLDIDDAPADALNVALARARLDTSTSPAAREMARRALDRGLTIDPAQVLWLEQATAHTRPAAVELPDGWRNAYWRQIQAWPDEYHRDLVRRCCYDAGFERRPGERLPTLDHVIAAATYTPTGRENLDRQRYAEWTRLAPVVQYVAARIVQILERIDETALERMTLPEDVPAELREAIRQAERKGEEPPVAPPSIRGEADRRAAAYKTTLDAEPADTKAARLAAWDAAEQARIVAMGWRIEWQAADYYGSPAAPELHARYIEARDAAKVAREEAEALGASPYDDARMCRPQHQRRIIRTEIRRTDAFLSAILGIVGGPENEALERDRRAGRINQAEYDRRKRPVYVSRWTLARHLDHARRTRQWAESQVIVKRDPVTGAAALDDDGKPVVLYMGDVIKSGIKARRSAAYATVKGMKEEAAAGGYVLLLLTLTLPSRFHSNPSKGGWKGGKRVRRDIAAVISPIDAKAEMQRRWTLLRALISRHHVDLFGLATREACEDMTPHMHAMLFVRPDHVPLLARLASYHFPEPAAEKLEEADQRRTELLFDAARTRRAIANARRILAMTRDEKKIAARQETIDGLLGDLRALQGTLADVRRSRRGALDKLAATPWYRRVAANIRLHVPRAQADEEGDTAEQAAEKAAERARIGELRAALSPYIDPEGKESASIETYLYEYATKHLDDGLEDGPEADPKKRARRDEALAHAAWARQIGVRRMSFIGVRRGLMGDWTRIYRATVADRRPEDPEQAAIFDAMKARNWHAALTGLGAFERRSPFFVETEIGANGYGEAVRVPVRLRGRADLEDEAGLAYRESTWQIMSRDRWQAEEEAMELVEAVRTADLRRLNADANETKTQDFQGLQPTVALTASCPSPAPDGAGTWSATAESLARIARDRELEEAGDWLFWSREPLEYADDPLADLDCAAYW